ncbi:MAG: thioredoxin [Pseudomonadota bacterium]
MNSETYTFDVTDENFQHAVLDNSAHVPVLVDFWAPWCGPCQSLMPLLEKLAGEYGGKFLLAKANIDEQQELAMQFGVRSVPTVKVFRHGQEQEQFTGALPESQLREVIERHIERESDRLLAEILQRFTDGQQQAALEQLRQLRQAEPENRRLLEQELEMLITMGELEEADSLLQSLPANIQQEEAIQVLQADLTLKRAISDAPDSDTLRQRLQQNPDDSQARHQLALRLNEQGDVEGALEALLELLRRDRSYGDEAARKGMLMLFEQLGPDDERVARYRRQMFNILH